MSPVRRQAMTKPVWSDTHDAIWRPYMSWWRHQMENFPRHWPFVLGNSPASGEFPAQRPVTWSFDVFFDLCLNKRLRKQSWGWWFETLSRPLWRHCNVSLNELNFKVPHIYAPVSEIHRLASVHCITMTLWWARWRLKSPASRLCTQPFVQAQNKESIKLRVTGFCEGNPPVAGEIPAQRASNAEIVSIWWRHHAQANCWRYWEQISASNHRGTPWAY